MLNVKGVKDSISLTSSQLSELISEHKDELISGAYVIVIQSDDTEKFIFNNEIANKWKELKKLIESIN